jgi:hypothetical protein
MTTEVCADCVLQASKNEEEDMLIYNWKPEYTGRQESREEEKDFQQTYIFGPASGRRQQQQQQQGRAVDAAGLKGSSEGHVVQGLLSKWLNWA